MDLGGAPIVPGPVVRFHLQRTLAHGPGCPARRESQLKDAARLTCVRPSLDHREETACVAPVACGVSIFVGLESFRQLRN